MSAFFAILRREFLGFFYAPIAYVLGAVFLALNGFSFWAVMQVLADPSQSTEAGAVLRDFFGGTLLHWLTVFAVTAALSMRSVAEDRRSGIWEALLTTRAEASTLLLGKWLALFLFYLCLWLPSLGLLVIFQAYLPAGQSLDPGPILASYLIVGATGAALLAIGVAVSTATESQVVAAVTSFAIFLGWLMLGEVSELSGADYSLFFLTDLRESAAAFGRGEVILGPLAGLTSVVLVALTVATALAAREGAKRIRLAVAALLLMVAAGSATHLIDEHGPRWDWTRSRINSLEASTQAALQDLPQDVSVTLVRPTEQVFEPVYEEIGLLLERMRRVQPRLEWESFDPLTDPGKLREWAWRLALRPEDVSSGGLVVVEADGRRRAIDLLDLAGFQRDDLGIGALSEFRAEAALRAAIAEVVERPRDRLCSSVAHGEFVADEGESSSSRPSWSLVAERLRTDGFEVAEVGRIDREALRSCQLLLLLGPSEPFRADELIVIDDFLSRGGKLLVALRADSGIRASGPTGIERVLEAYGIEVLPARVVDPAFALDEGSRAWLTYEGYSEHAIVRDFQGRRATLWSAPLALRLSGEGSQALVQASEHSWAETDLAAVRSQGFQRGPEDLEERVVASASEGSQGERIVLFGSAESFSGDWSQRGLGANERLLVSSVLWLLGHRTQLEAENKRPEHLRLIMSKSQLRRAFFWCVIAGPVLFSLLGALLWWWRRREP